MDLTIEKASASNAHELTHLTRRSKAYWGYSKEQIEKWHKDLLISEEYLLNHHVYVVKENEQTIGYYSFQYLSKSAIRLDNIFIEPDYIGKGIGKQLMNDFLKRIKALTVQTVTLDAEPNAAGFYQKFGFKTISKKQSSIPGRHIPVMELSFSSLPDVT
ncbi:MAG: GNAT family N-acetyltransferase [Bacteroidota bacterium]